RLRVERVCQPAMGGALGHDRHGKPHLQFCPEPSASEAAVLELLRPNLRGASDTVHLDRGIAMQTPEQTRRGARWLAVRLVARRVGLHGLPRSWIGIAESCALRVPRASRRPVQPGRNFRVRAYGSLTAR